MDETKSTTSTAKGIPSLLESVVDIRFLVLLLCFICYLDLWLVGEQIDPTTLSISSVYHLLLKVPAFQIIVFIGSYSLLMIGFFPAVRGLLSFARLHIFHELKISNTTKESKQLSDWASGCVCFSAYGAIASSFVDVGQYKGLAHHIYTLSSSPPLVAVFFKIGIFTFWAYCVHLALKADGLDFED